jgi:hypothetical protein
MSDSFGPQCRIAGTISGYSYQSFAANHLATFLVVKRIDFAGRATYQRLNQRPITTSLCPICAAAIGEHCQMYSGLGRRKGLHSERKYHAIQAIEQGEHGYGRYELLRTFIRVETAHIWQGV